MKKVELLRLEGVINNFKTLSKYPELRGSVCRGNQLQQKES